jgi:hypothetical protein
MIYTVTLNDKTTMRIEYAPEEPSAPICFDAFEDEELWQNTPYQAADARDAEHAANLVAKYIGDGAKVLSVTEAL